MLLLVEYANKEKRDNGRLLPPRSAIYISDVRQRQVAEFGVKVSEYSLLPLMIRAYTKREEDAYPLVEVRCGLAA